MARVKGKNTKPEKVVRSTLHAMGYRFRLHRRDLPGRPDIVLPRRRAVVQVFGCFWHSHPGCPRATRPVNNAGFWAAKLDGNAARDRRDIAALEEAGWRVLVVWECQTKDPVTLRGLLDTFLGSGGI